MNVTDLTPASRRARAALADLVEATFQDPHLHSRMVHACGSSSRAQWVGKKVAECLVREAKLVLAASRLRSRNFEAVRQARAQLRTELAAELRSARARLLELKTKSNAWCKAVVNAARQANAGSRYPDVPPPSVPASQEPAIPAFSGVYFVWKAGAVVYVGQSLNLRARCRLGSHHAMDPGDLLSWVEISQADLNFAECHYIGLLRPGRNFGMFGKFYRKHAPSREALAASEETLAGSIQPLPNPCQTPAS